MDNVRRYTLDELQQWAGRIEEIARSFGLDFYRQEFEIVNYETMLEQITYYGMQSYYPHWSHGKQYDRQETLYRYGLSYLPYELVINSNPSVAYLMDRNPLALHLLTIAHVYAHNDFFKNNINYAHTYPKLVLEFFHSAAQRIRSYIADPSIGEERVEAILDAARALMWHRPPIPGDHYETQDIKRARLQAQYRDSLGRQKEWAHIQDTATKPPDLSRLPVEPEKHLLLFIRDHSTKNLSEWEKDILTIVAQEFEYFMPQIMTKIMNEGWATYWHKKIIDALGLPADFALEIADYNSKVIRLPDNPLSINPYLVGFELWEEIFRRYEHPTKKEQEKYGLIGGQGTKQLFGVRRVGNDVSFLESYLTPALMRNLFFFQYLDREDEYTVEEIPDDEGCDAIRQTLLQRVGMNIVPGMRIANANLRDQKIFYLQHEFNGRFLDREYAEKTIEYAYALWGRPILLRTTIIGKNGHTRRLLWFNGKEHAKPPKLDIDQKLM